MERALSTSQTRISTSSTTAPPSTPGVARRATRARLHTFRRSGSRAVPHLLLRRAVGILHEPAATRRAPTRRIPGRRRLDSRPGSVSYGEAVFPERRTRRCFSRRTRAILRSRTTIFRASRSWPSSAARSPGSRHFASPTVCSGCRERSGRSAGSRGTPSRSSAYATGLSSRASATRAPSPTSAAVAETPRSIMRSRTSCSRIRRAASWTGLPTAATSGSSARRDSIWRSGAFSRTPADQFPEYHSSADDLEFVRPEHLGESFATLLDVIDLIESNDTYRNLSPYGEPQLGRRGLYRGIGGGSSEEMALLWVLSLSDGTHEPARDRGALGGDLRPHPEGGRPLWRNTTCWRERRREPRSDACCARHGRRERGWARDRQSTRRGRTRDRDLRPISRAPRRCRGVALWRCLRADHALGRRPRRGPRRRARRRGRERAWAVDIVVHAAGSSLALGRAGRSTLPAVAIGRRHEPGRGLPRIPSGPAGNGLSGHGPPIALNSYAAVRSAPHMPPTAPARRRLRIWSSRWKLELQATGVRRFLRDTGLRLDRDDAKRWRRRHGSRRLRSEATRCRPQRVAALVRRIARGDADLAFGTFPARAGPPRRPSRSRLGDRARRDSTLPASGVFSRRPERSPATRDRGCQ